VPRRAIGLRRARETTLTARNTEPAAALLIIGAPNFPCPATKQRLSRESNNRRQFAEIRGFLADAG
jgi:hypothetical protein